MTDLRKMFDMTIRSAWDSVPFDADDMEAMRKSEWYKDAFIDAVKNKKYNEGLLMIIANANSELYSFERAFVSYKLHFGSLGEQEGALNALECLEDKSFILFTKDATIKNYYLQEDLKKYIHCCSLKTKDAV